MSFVLQGTGKDTPLFPRLRPLMNVPTPLALGSRQTPRHHPHPRFLPSVQIVAAILAIAGIVMMTYADGFHSHSVIGIALVVGSASMSALYKVSAGSELAEEQQARYLWSISEGTRALRRAAAFTGQTDLQG